MNKTNIEFLDFTWNPIAMCCTPVSEGCTHCWHLALCNRLAANPKMSTIRRNAYAGLVGPQLIQKELDAPLKRKKPARIGVQFMGDLFLDDVISSYTARIIDIIAIAQHHTFLILTKREKSMARFFEDYYRFFIQDPPIKNLWLGVSAENQQTADERIPILLQIPAAKRFVSIEPMLGPVDLQFEAPDSKQPCPHCNQKGCEHCGNVGYLFNSITWVIVGGLSLPGGKIQAPKRDWLDSIVEQCSDVGVPIFLKDNARYPIERREFPK